MTHHFNQTRAPVLISLPDGLSVSGVTLWAARLAGVLAARGHAVTLAVHEEPAGQSRVPLTIPPGVNVLSLRSLPALRNAGGDLWAFIPPYRDEVRRLARESGSPVAFIPTLLGDCFGIGAAISLADPESIRVIGWQHADSAYDTRLLTYYEPVLTSLVGVSRRIAQTIGTALAHRAAEVVHLPNAVPVGHAPPERLPVRGRALRLVYTGRIEHKQKRVTALIEMSDDLERRGVAHTLTLLGDGPAFGELRATVKDGRRAARVTLPGPVGADAVRHALREADCFVLASRYEGLSVAMIEAMAEGCVPIITGVASGASEVVVDGLNGLLVQTPADAPDRDVAGALADAVVRFASSDQGRFAAEAWGRVRDSFSLQGYAPRAGALIDAAVSAPARAWPAARPASFTASSNVAASSGSVPLDAHRRLSRKLAELSGKRVILHGAGRHTIDLAGTLAASPALVVAIADDDPGRWGQTLFGWPIIAPREAHKFGATDVVISSWLHADEVFSRRDVYLQQGLCVHHLYRDARQMHTDSYTSAACSN